MTMSEHADQLDQQIAALEAALSLPLPADARQRLMADLRALRDQRATHAGGAAIQGTTEVSGTLQGVAVGVNLGTVQAFSSTPSFASAAQPAPTVSQAEIDDQLELLESHRRTLGIYLKRLAQLGSANAPPEVFHGVREARDAIGRIKAALRSWGAAVVDRPDDTAPTR